MKVQSKHEPDLFQKKTNEWSLRYGILESIHGGESMRNERKFSYYGNLKNRKFRSLWLL